MSFNNPTRRGLLKTGAVASAGLALPTYLRADGHAGFLNAPQGDTVTLGFNVPQSGPYADEGADELRAYELAVEHLNGGGGATVFWARRSSMSQVTHRPNQTRHVLLPSP